MLEMQRPCSVASDQSKRYYRFDFSEAFEKRLVREMPGTTRVIREVEALDHVLSVGFSSSEHGFGLTIRQTPGLTRDELDVLDQLVETAIEVAVDELLSERLATKNDSRA